MRPAHRSRPVVEYESPRLSILHVLNRVRMRMLDIQVWDVAGTMTFYAVLSLFPGAVAVVSMLSMLGIGRESVEAAATMVHEVFPTLDPRPFVSAILAVSTTNGGLLGLALGTAGSLLSASNGVAAFHRALHRVYDTREGRPFLWFRTIVFGETVLIVAVALLALSMLVIGSDASQRLGELIGIPRVAFVAWNIVKWPILLIILIIGVSLAYYLFPNVKLPRYRLMTLGSVVSVLMLFGSAHLLGQLMVYATRFTEVLTVLNGLIGILLLLWLGNIVIIGGAALDAEFLRARQIASGLEAWHTIVLDSHATHTLDFLAEDAAEAERIGRAVALSARDGAPLRRERSVWIVDAGSVLAVNPPRRHRVTSPSQSGPTSSAAADDPDRTADDDADRGAGASPESSGSSVGAMQEDVPDSASDRPPARPGDPPA